ncbi:hypothetical protein ABZ609_35770, partial [Streptomyces rubiginosohelvolus]|uniref:hypothetical protein n=1 Tax=Streptomyces rubiginosohelvolus TaxID=67362 RepID=UPI0033D3ACFF
MATSRASRERSGSARNRRSGPLPRRPRPSATAVDPPTPPCSRPSATAVDPPTLARYKRQVEQRWGEMVYDGLWFSPLK